MKKHIAIAVAATFMVASGGTALAQDTTATTTVPVDDDDDGDEGKWGLLGLLGLAGLLGLKRRDNDHHDTTRRP